MTRQIIMKGRRQLLGDNPTDEQRIYWSCVIGHTK